MNKMDKNPTLMELSHQWDHLRMPALFFNNVHKSLLGLQLPFPNGSFVEQTAFCPYYCIPFSMLCLEELKWSLKLWTLYANGSFIQLLSLLCAKCRGHRQAWILNLHFQTIARQPLPQPPLDETNRDNLVLSRKYLSLHHENFLKSTLQC